MGFFDFLRPRRTPAPQAADTGRRAASAVETGARPTYAPILNGTVLLGRPESFRLLEQFNQAIPAVPRAIEILSGFVGTPEFRVKDNEAATQDLNNWAQLVPHGHVGTGLGTWLPDLIGQALLYGFAVGEAVPSEQRDTVGRMWSYKTPSFGFRARADGTFDIVQQQIGAGLKALDPLTMLLAVHRPQGSDPNGRALFFASHTFCQAWIDIAHAYRSTWLRCGQPTFHVNWQPDNPENFDDPDGTVALGIIKDLKKKWVEAIKSQVVDGKAMDFFSSGKTTVTTIGADGQVIDVEVGKRAVVEEIITATGLPPWMFGLTWSTTERLSSQQARNVISTVDCIRAAVTPAIRKAADLRQRLAGKREGLAFEVLWPDIDLTELLDSARAAMMDAQAAETRRKTWRALWQDGVIDQARYAEETTGSDQVVRAMEEPPAVAPASADPGPNPGGDGENLLDDDATQKALAELADEYRDKFPERCGGH